MSGKARGRGRTAILVSEVESRAAVGPATDVAHGADYAGMNEHQGEGQ